MKDGEHMGLFWIENQDAGRHMPGHAGTRNNVWIGQQSLRALQALRVVGILRKVGAQSLLNK